MPLKEKKKKIAILSQKTDKKEKIRNLKTEKICNLDTDTKSKIRNSDIRKNDIRKYAG